MSSVQRSIIPLIASISGASADVPSDPYEVPKGVGVGGFQVWTTLGTGGNFAGGTVGAVLEATNQPNATDDGPLSSATWTTIAGGELPAASAAASAYLGDGNLTVDLSPYRWIRLRPFHTGSPVSIIVQGAGKFDYWKG
jgi:hypothetical protein